MKAQLIAIIAVIICITSALFINPINSALVATTTIQTSGTIIQNNMADSKLTVILRGICITNLNPYNMDINAWVDNFVSEHSRVTAITISDMHQYGIWWYGYTFSQTQGTWMGWTYQQLKELIDRFHYHGWKVGLETTGIAWNEQEEYRYITTLHPELAYTSADGLKATGIDNAARNTKNPGFNNVIPDFFAKFATADTTNNITVGTRLIDLYTSRLTKMITDGLSWDFWFGTDGWNGFNNQGYRWNYQTASLCYSFSAQEENEYGNWTEAILPANWNTMTQIEKAQAIISNSTILNNWWYYWQIRFAELYAQIKQSFIDAGESSMTFHLIGSADTSSAPGNPGGLCPAGMYNMSLFGQLGSMDFIYVDQEFPFGSPNLAADQAYVGALVKMQNPSLQPIIGLQPIDCGGGQHSLWEVKQAYLAQAVNYIWYNGMRYCVSPPNIIMMQYGYGNWTQQEIDEFYNFIESTSKLLLNASPIWLGPLFATPNYISGAMGNAWYRLNWTFAQWAWTANLENNPQYIKPAMGTILMDEALQETGPSLQGLNDKMIGLWSSDQLNLWYWENSGRDWGISAVFAPPATSTIQSIENQAANAFHITRSYGTTGNFSVLHQLTDPLAKYVAAGYEGTTYSLSTNHYLVHGVYIPQDGFVTIAGFINDTPNRIAIGYYKNATTSTFLLTHMANVLPKSMINKLLYMSTDCPIKCSESLIDLKVLQNGNKLLIPMSNQRDIGEKGPNIGVTITATLTINAKTLGLAQPSAYNIYWQSNNVKVNFTDWNSINISLNGMADTLVITPK